MAVNGRAILDVLRAELSAELTGRILPYWAEFAVDATNGGFVGLVTSDGQRHHDAPKGGVLNARILWTFAAAYRVLGDPRWRAMAQRARHHFAARFLDPAHGGCYWMVEAAGAPRDDRKHIYCQAFAIYALSEHFRATADPGSLDHAIELYRLVERHAADPVHGGYREAFSREWVPLDDARLSDQDAHEPRSMNTHLHLLEAYASLLRVWPDPGLRVRLAALIDLFLDVVVDRATGHVVCFFADDWSPRSTRVSYGHDIESSWLLLEAADVLGDAELRERVRSVAIRIADAVRLEGVDAAGGIFNEGGPEGVLDTDKDWWPQAEAIVGFVNAYQQTARAEFLEAAWLTWRFVRRSFLDVEHGEWHWRVARDGELRTELEKVGPWKCPYHNARACLEILQRAVEAPV